MSTEPNPAAPVNPPAPTNNPALVGLIVGVITVLAVILRPYWLISDLLGAAAIILGFVGLSMANRAGTDKRLSICAIVLGFAPLVPLVLVLATRMDYY